MCSYAKLGKRIAWLDSLKMFAMFLVVFGHCCSLQSNNLIGIHYLDQWIVSFNMPLFVFVSGLVAYKSLNGLYSWTDCLSYIRKISERIALPNVCFSCFVGFFIHFWGSFEFSLRALFNIVVFSFFFIIVFFQDKSIIRKCYNWIMLLPFVMNIFGIYSYFWFLSMLLFVMGGDRHSNCFCSENTYESVLGCWWCILDDACVWGRA